MYEGRFYRRLKLLLRTLLLHRLNEMNSRQSWDTSRSYDPMSLCVSAIDLVMNREGLEDAYDFEKLIEALAIVADPEALAGELHDVVARFSPSRRGEPAPPGDSRPRGAAPTSS